VILILHIGYYKKAPGPWRFVIRLDLGLNLGLDLRLYGRGSESRVRCLHITHDQLPMANGQRRNDAHGGRAQGEAKPQNHTDPDAMPKTT
jgi:hypothetical protein